MHSLVISVLVKGGEMSVLGTERGVGIRREFDELSVPEIFYWFCLLILSFIVRYSPFSWMV